MRLPADDDIPEKTFLNGPYVPDPAAVQTPYAFVGIPYGPPYHASDLTLCADGADEVRRESYRRAYGLNGDHFDFDLGDVLFPEGSPTVSDCGQVVGDIRDSDAIWDRAVEFLTTLVGHAVVPLVVGGFDAIPPMLGAAFANETVNVLHIDSHIDFREERYGVHRGYSSPIRRLREMPWVREIVQVGLRSLGSARAQEVAEAIASGNRFVTAWELHDSGAAPLLDSLSAEDRWLIAIDCDGLDTSIAPGVGAREPGGLTMHEIRTLVAGLAMRNKIAGVVVTEYQPSLDIQAITAQTIVRLLVNVIGHQRSPKRNLPAGASQPGTMVP